ncbi:MAG TPA: CHASE2 domain-containing protein, partial [Methylomirabilota bacterium]|nr:CHASE2 domain-containing protein [Methylomirabilota bacterium]
MSSPRPSPPRSRTPSSWAALVVVLACWLAIALGWPRLDLEWHDALTKFWLSPADRKAPSSRVVLVKITDVSVAQRARTPLPRDLLAKLIEEIARTGPKAIVLAHTIERDRTTRDLALYSAMTNAGNVLLQQETRPGPGGRRLIEPLVEPFQRLTNRIAPALFEPDVDGRVRSVRLKFNDVTGREQPTLAALAAGYGETDLATLPERIPLRFRAAPEALFPSLAAEELSRWTNTAPFSPLASLVTSNTVVIVGPFFAGADRFDAPAAVADTEGAITASHLLAYAVDSLAQPVRPSAMHA